MPRKMAVWLVGLLLLVSSIASAQQTPGSGSDQDAAKLRLKLPFVDRTQFVDRGTIAYTIPPTLNDGIQVADARELADLTGVLKLLNQTEVKNQDFRVGKGEPHKRGGKKPYDPKLVGCIDSVLVAKNGKLVLEEYFADARIDKPHYQMSITKSILAYAIGKALEQQKIKSVNDRLVDYLARVGSRQAAGGCRDTDVARSADHEIGDTGQRQGNRQPLHETKSCWPIAFQNEADSRQQAIQI